MAVIIAMAALGEDIMRRHEASPWISDTVLPVPVPGRRTAHRSGANTSYRERDRRDDGRPAVAGGIRWHVLGPADEDRGGRRGCHSDRAALWRRHRGAAAREAAALLLDRDGPGGTDFRRPLTRQLRARHERLAVFLSRL